VWETWRPRDALAADLCHARQRLTSAKHVWSKVSGPAAAFLASALRLGWQVHDFNRVSDDCGNEFRFDRDPPALVKAAVVESVRRWQMRRIDAALPAAGLNGNIRLDPIRKLLRPNDRDGLWTTAHRA
jgi:hypothetical protein